ncbi:MAG: cobyric acid synthase [Dehalococcoidia bacterium]
MIQGTASSVGKSLLVAGLCRLFRQDGLRVAPFKAQNMSNNAAVTPDGNEIGRAQAVQAEAAGVVPTVDMNPILLKPEADHRSQVVLRGKPAFTLQGGDFLTRKADLWPFVTESLDRLRADHDLVVIEGAGSPAEINLRSGDIVNMRVALHAQSPVLLAGDIDRGGVFAHLYGTIALLEPEERSLIKGFIINKFRGDIGLLRPGIPMFEARAGLPVLAIVPYLRDLRIADEDAVSLETHRGSTAGALDIAVIKLPHIANFDDIDPLEREPDVSVRYVSAAEALNTPDLVVIPGTKATISDLRWLHDRGLAAAIRVHADQGGAVLGLCGGFQMIGTTVDDPDGVESEGGIAEGLRLLHGTTVMIADKSTHLIEGEVMAGPGLLAGSGVAPLRGYEIHIGRTVSQEPSPVRMLSRSGEPCDQLDGAFSADGWVLGTYVHGFLDNDLLRARILGNLARRRGVAFNPAPPLDRQAEYDRLASTLRDAFNLPALYRIAELDA